MAEREAAVGEVERTLTPRAPSGEMCPGTGGHLGGALPELQPEPPASLGPAPEALPTSVAARASPGPDWPQREPMNCPLDLHGALRGQEQRLVCVPVTWRVFDTVQGRNLQVFNEKKRLGRAGQGRAPCGRLALRLVVSCARMSPSVAVVRFSPA